MTKPFQRNVNNNASLKWHKCVAFYRRKMITQERKITMILGTTYISVSDMKKSVDFYKKLLNEEPIKANDNRWVQFHNKIALYNKSYDARIIGTEPSERFNQAYIDDFYKDTGEPKNNLVVFNFVVEDLKSEYERVKGLNIGEVSKLMYVNVHMPYWYFNVIDPDGNTIEITGKCDLQET